MSLPREVVPGRWYMMTRRCALRQLLLRPDEETNEIFLYCLGLAAEQTGVQIAFTMACANHHHTGIYDPQGRYPEFLQRFHGLAARCLNARWGRWENVWSVEQASVVRLLEPVDVVAKMIYALTNPVKDGLVERAHHWPGASSLAATLRGTEIRASRPKRFFRSDGDLPESVTIALAMPPGFSREMLERGIAEVEAAAAEERRRTGRRVLGRAGVLNQSWRERARGTEPRRGLRPRLAGRSRWARIEALQRSKEFLDAYRRAREALMRGLALIPFPPGTYWPRQPAHIPRAAA